MNPLSLSTFLAGFEVRSTGWKLAGGANHRNSSLSLSAPEGRRKARREAPRLESTSGKSRPKRQRRAAIPAWGNVPGIRRSLAGGLKARPVASSAPMDRAFSPRARIPGPPGALPHCHLVKADDSGKQALGTGLVWRPARTRVDGKRRAQRRRDRLTKWQWGVAPGWYGVAPLALNCRRTTFAGGLILQRPSGARLQVGRGSGGWHHRLISVAPPGRTEPAPSEGDVGNDKG